MITEPCVQGLDDTDLYKESVRKAYLAKYPGVEGVFQFQDRRPHRKYDQYFLDALNEQIQYIGTLRTEPATINFLAAKTPWLGKEYLEWLRNWKPDPSMVEAKVEDGLLDIVVRGPLEDSSPWEIYLMETVSELNFKLIETDWSKDGQREGFRAKLPLLTQLDAWSEFGSRRRRDWETQSMVVEESIGQKGFVGSSNIRLSRLNDMTPKGTYPHEWVQAVSAMESLRYANRFSMKIWQEIFGGWLGTALPDTFGSDAFLKDFTRALALAFDSVRHDSGDPLEFAEKFIRHYVGLGIDPMTKTIIFSDNLNPQKCLDIRNALLGRIRTAFGIGTNLTNDYPGSPALNMVIKLVKVGGIYVVKLSDTPIKQIGNIDALRVANWIFKNLPLDGMTYGNNKGYR